MTKKMTVTLTGRETAIIGAMLRCCIGWTDPNELRRFVNVASEHVCDGWSEQEMDDVLEKLCGAWQDAEVEQGER